MSKTHNPRQTQPLLPRLADATVPAVSEETTDPGPAPGVSSVTADKRDTQRMLQGPADKTVPIAARPITLPPAGERSMSGASLTPVPTAEEVEETRDILQAFGASPLRAPAPRPKQQASSDGGAFVAYSAVGRPAPRVAADDRDWASVELERMVSAPDPSIASDGPLVAQRDIPTIVAAGRRGPSAWQVVAALAAVVSIGGVVAAIVVHGRASVASPAAVAAVPPSAPVAASAAAALAPSAPAAATAPAPVEASDPVPSAPTSPPLATAAASTPVALISAASAVTAAPRPALAAPAPPAASAAATSRKPASRPAADSSSRPFTW